MRAENLVDAPHIVDVLPDVMNILNDASIIVGHGLEHDMEVLGLRFPEDQVRDTSLYGPFINRRGRTPGLKSLVKKHLGYDIQVTIIHVSCLENVFFPAGRTRSCGGCQSCSVLVPQRDENLGGEAKKAETCHESDESDGRSGRL